MSNPVLSLSTLCLIRLSPQDLDTLSENEFRCGMCVKEMANDFFFHELADVFSEAKQPDAAFLSNYKTIPLQALLSALIAAHEDTKQFCENKKELKLSLFLRWINLFDQLPVDQIIAPTFLDFLIKNRCVESIKTIACSQLLTPKQRNTLIHYSDAALFYNAWVTGIIVLEGKPLLVFSKAAYKNGETLLQYAAFDDYVPSVQRLLDAGASKDASDLNGHTPLHNASIEGSTGAVKLLLNAGANVKAVDADGKTPLYYAKIYHRHEIIKLLEEAEAATANS